MKTLNTKIEYFGDSILDIGILGSSNGTIDIFKNELKIQNLEEDIWSSPIEYLAYLKPRFQLDKFEEFEKTFKKNYLW